MPTGQTIVNNALTALNILDAGGSASASESVDLLAELNTMLDAWSAEETLVPSIATAQYALTASLNPYALGPVTLATAGNLLGTKTTISGITDANPAVMTYAALVPALVSTQLLLISGFTGNWAPANGVWAITVASATTFSIALDSTTFGAIAGTPVFQLGAPRPVRIDQAVLVATVGAATIRRTLRIVGSPEYFSHGDLAASASTADEMYPDYADAATGDLSLYFFPVPTCPTATKIELEVWNAIAAFTLPANQNLPPGYQDGIQQALAFRCLPRYGAAVNAETAQIVATLGVSAKDRIKTLNVKNRVLDPSLAPPTENQQRAQTAQQPQQR